VAGFWNDQLTTPRKEKIVQAVAGQMWVLLCERSDVDVAGSRTSAAGRLTSSSRPGGAAAR
jgi:hypothetical protein